jgi:hypothetical protein
MIELRDITKELLQVGRRLSRGADELFKLAKEKAEAERNYRQTLAAEILRLRQEGHPVTLVPDLARGNIAEAKFERDLAEAKYVAGREALDSLRQQASALQSILRYQEDA